MWKTVTCWYTALALGSKWWIRYLWWTVASDFMWGRDLLRVNVRVIWVRVLQETLGGWMHTVRWNYIVYAKSGFGYCGVWTRCLGSDITAWCDIGLGVDIYIYIYILRVFWAPDITGDFGWSRWWIRYLGWTVGDDYVWGRLLLVNVRVIWVRVLQATLGRRMHTVRWNYSMDAQSGFGYCGLWTGCLGSDVTGDIWEYVCLREMRLWYVHGIWVSILQNVMGDHLGWMEVRAMYTL